MRELRRQPSAPITYETLYVTQQPTSASNATIESFQLGIASALPCQIQLFYSSSRYPPITDYRLTLSASDRFLNLGSLLGTGVRPK